MDASPLQDSLGTLSSYVGSIKHGILAALLITLSSYVGSIKHGILAALLIMCGCSTMKTQVAPLASQRVHDGTYSILVLTGHPGMDKILYEIAYMELGSLININETGSLIEQGGKVEIIFTSTSQGMFLASGTTVNSAITSATGWYYGNGYWGGTGYTSGTTATIASGTTLTWQNSTMLMTLRDKAGNRLWTADYNYKGGWEMSGWVVNTADEAARLCIKRLKKRFKADIFKGNSSP